ncbi:hypothetical protein BU24DRAFT_109751 [Aaosphaeria arxii CBS 175.79]|uniref:Uncharacterized protein n=1 Tax=Aaosphaeria arxii CBS 175.79 TaxID=1450172 RepID=A0A6A5Y1Q0_9PLEO|nr:uncharacterized protein BU24DRAFT_109751 [Aaosphaeria arxii CBS 175.79]KAF2018987.1 hypothetical protein BU24DRAFT_109751 [Aaosphaeria arxii CBS 175.79]
MHQSPLLHSDPSHVVPTIQYAARAQVGRAAHALPCHAMPCFPRLHSTVWDARLALAFGLWLLALSKNDQPNEASIYAPMFCPKRDPSPSLSLPPFHPSNLLFPSPLSLSAFYASHLPGHSLAPCHGCHPPSAGVDRGA